MLHLRVGGPRSTRISLSRFLRQRLNFHRHIFGRAFALDGQPHLLPNRRQPEQVAHLGRAADSDIIGLQDDIAPLQTRALRRRTERDLGDPRSFQMTSHWCVDVVKRDTDATTLDATLRSVAPSPCAPC
jgi:hypothetical protein